MMLAFLSPEDARTVLLVLLAVGYAGYHAWVWWQGRLWRGEEAEAREVGPSSTDVVGSPMSKPAQTPPPPPTGESPGEEDFKRACVMPHREIPDFRTDGLHLDLLGKSADKGYAPAMAMLGAYAMWRGTWVEAYYWTWRAQRGGVPNLEAALRRIRHCWTTAGCPSEEEYVNDLFDAERASVGRALLDIASGRRVADAREFLKENYPAFLLVK